MEDLLGEFLHEATGGADAVEAALLRADSGDIDALNAASARLEALASTARALSLFRCERIARAAASLLIHGGKARPLILRALLRFRDVCATLASAGIEPPGDDGDLVSAAERDRLPSIADTLAHARDRLLEISPGARDPRLEALLSRLANLGAELANAATNRSIAECASPLAPLIEHLAAREGKRVALQLEGDVAIEEEALEPLREALSLIATDACTNSIETPRERRAAGKSEIARLRITAYRAAESSIIEIAHDGRGIDIAGFRARALAKGVLPPDAILRMADSEIIRLSLAPGLSGDGGVGASNLEAARTAIDRLGGQLTINPAPGGGAVYMIALPDIGAEFSPPQAVAKRKPGRVRAA